MIERVNSNGASLRTIDVDMSSEAIAQRIREAGELNELGLSLAKAKRCSSPYVTTEVDVSQEVPCIPRDEPSAEK